MDVFLVPLVVLLLGLVSANTGYAQQVSGVVTDATSGSTLPGVNVIVKGTTQGTSTGTDGSYSLNVPTLQDTLVFSFIGYQKQEVPIQGRTKINIVLKSQAISGDELVVVGYGKQKKKTLTGSISKVSGSDVTVSPSPNVTSSLEGKLPGLVVNQRTGEPGREDLNILIRGNGTFNNNDPLVVIDGVPRDNLSQLNPNDIEDITVLKDASAAIYGARAANGVILVTTKQGSKSKPKFNFSYSYAFQQPTKIPNMLDAATFATAFNEAEWYRQGRPDKSNFTPFYTDKAIQKYRNGSDPVLYPNTDWVSEVLKPYSANQKVNLQASGGSANIQYLLSFGMTDQDGNFKNNPTHYKKYNARAKVNVDLTEDLTVGANISANLNQRKYPSVGTQVNFINILQANPTLVAKYPNGLIAPGRLQENPLLLDRRGYDRFKDYPINSTFTASYNVPFVKGLALDASYNYDLRNQFEKLFSKPYSFHKYNVQTGKYDKVWATNASTVQLTDTYSRWTKSLFNFRVSYETTIGKYHNISAMVGTEQQRQNYSYAMAYRKNFVSSAIPQINVGSTNPKDMNNGGSASESAYNNYFGRLNYDYNSKYLLEFVFRYDGSQIFPKGNRYGFFPGVSAGWRLSEEDFIRDNLPFVSELKLRGSYGELGNDRVGAYQYLQSFSFGDNYVFGAGDVPGITPNTLPNPDITWEVSKKLDLGLEATLWDGLLGADITLWKENRSNILLQPNRSVSHVYGFSGLPDKNIGKVENRGFEIVLTHQNNIGDLSYSIRANTSFARSKIKFMDETPQAEPYQTQTGHPLGSGLYYKSDGIFNTQQELDNYPHGPGAQVGDIKVVDLNNDGVIDGKDRYRTDNSPTPEYTFGLTTNFKYKGFDLTLFFQGQTNAYTYDGTVATLGGSDFANAAVYRAKDRWTVDNKDATMPRADQWTPGATDFFLFDATFVRLKNAELGYSLPHRLLSKVGAGSFKDLRFYVNGSNLLTWAKEIKWRDPEMGGDFTNYPPLRIINVGVNVNF